MDITINFGPQYDPMPVCADVVGTATRMKLIHSMMLGTVVASLAEGMALANRVGLDPKELHEVLCLGGLGCDTINHKCQGASPKGLCI